MGGIADLFHSDPGWGCAVENLRGLESEHGEEAQARALGYAAAYDGARGAMIVDVVASRQRRYKSRVTGIVSDWKAQNAEHTMAWLADHRLEHQRYGSGVPARRPRAHIVPTICPQLHISHVIYRDEFMQLTAYPFP